MTNYTYDPFNTVGFDRLFDRLARMHETAQNQSGYPPYNIIKNGEDEYVIELAVAGFTIDELDITFKDQTITVKGTPKKEEKTYVHKGIASRAFTRTFTLADTIEIVDADLKSGMLYIMLKNIIPENKKERKIAIGAQPKTENQLLTE
jgi:molecular chaperone IbpA